jgi:hypothetical protein
LDKYTNPEICGLPTADKLRAALEASESADVRAEIAQLFDAGTFVEVATYMQRGFSDFISTEKAN